MKARSIVCAAGLVFGGPASILWAQQRSAYEELQTFSGVLNYVRANYVDSVGVSDLVQAAIDGTLHSLDPHSYFIRRQDWERFAAWEQGRFVTRMARSPSSGSSRRARRLGPACCRGTGSSRWTTRP